MDCLGQKKAIIMLRRVIKGVKLCGALPSIVLRSSIKCYLGYYVSFIQQKTA